jgi:hypothetical protein
MRHLASNLQLLRIIDHSAMALRAQAPLSLNEGSWISMAAAITAYYLIHAWFKPECTTTSVYSEERKKKVGNI